MVTLYDMKSATNVPPTADHDQTAATRGRVQRHRHPALRRPPREVVRPLHAQRLRGDLAAAAVDAGARLKGEREKGFYSIQRCRLARLHSVISYGTTCVTLVKLSKKCKGQTFSKS